jgi:hypothetical protein
MKNCLYTENTQNETMRLQIKLRIFPIFWIFTTSFLEYAKWNFLNTDNTAIETLRKLRIREMPKN